MGLPLWLTAIAAATFLLPVYFIEVRRFETLVRGCTVLVRFITSPLSFIRKTV